MSLTLGRFCWQVAITAGTNNAMHWTEGAVDVLTTTLPTGTYDTPESLIDAIAASMTTASNARGNAYGYTGAVSSAGLVSFMIDTEHMAVSTHAEGCTIAHVIGMTDGVATTGATVQGGYQHHGSFYFKTDGPDLANKTEWGSEHTAPMSVCEDGSIVQRPIGSTREQCQITIGNSPEDDMFSSDNREQAIEDLYDFIVAGNSRAFRWYEDAADTAAWTTIHWQSHSVDFVFDPPRDDPALERWSFDMAFRKHV